jgi:hypothetical protein
MYIDLYIYKYVHMNIQNIHICRCIRTHIYKRKYLFIYISLFKINVNIVTHSVKVNNKIKRVKIGPDDVYLSSSLYTTKLNESWIVANSLLRN